MSERTIINILIAEDHPYTAEGLKYILMSKPDYAVAGVVADGQQVLNFLHRKIVDIVLMDFRMPVMDGVEATKLIRERFGSVSVIGISGFDDEDYMFEMLRAGAKGIILKSSEVIEIHRAIENVSSGSEYFCSRSIPVIYRKMKYSSPVDGGLVPHEGYSDTELRVIKEICKQKTSKEISGSLSLSEKTIHYYRQRLMEKMDVKSSIGIVLFAIRHKMINIKDVI